MPKKLNGPQMVKQANSPYWSVRLTINGKRTWRTTKKKSRKLAEKEALKIIDEHEQAEGSPAFTIVQRAAEDLRHNRLDAAKAQGYLSDLMKLAGLSQIPKTTVGKFCQDWAEAAETSTATNTANKRALVARRFAESVGPDRLVITLTVADVSAFVASESKRGLLPSSVNLHLKIVRTMLEQARLNGLLMTNPAKDVPTLSEKSTAVERDVFNLAEVARLMSAADDDWRGMILFAFFTGARISDIARLRWEQIDERTGVIKFKQSKIYKNVVLPLHPEIMRWLDTRERGEYIFPFHGKADSTSGALSDAFRRLMERAGVERKMTAHRGSGRNRYNVSFHSFRHTCASMLANAGVPLEVRQKITGHQDATTALHYTHLDVQVIREAVSLLSLESREG